MLDTPVSTLLGETVAPPVPDEVAVLADKLACINQQLAKRQRTGQQVLFGVLLLVWVTTAVLWVILLATGSPYLAWDYSDPETAVMATALHAFEWLFVRLAPVILIGTGAGAVWMARRWKG